MRKIFNILSVLGLGCGLGLIALIYFSSVDADPFDRASAPITTTKFSSFSLDKPRIIEFDLEDQGGNPMTARERRDQALDWLLYAILSDAGLSAEQLNEVTFDLPPSRYGYLRPIANFEFGRTRSRSLGDGRVIALVPSDASETQRLDHLAYIFDEQRKNLGEAPVNLIVFDYELDTDERGARITRRPDVDGEGLLSAKYGYIEAKILSLDDLEKFLAATDDVTFANFAVSGLTLGGRKIQSYKYRGIRVEDVAALWQSEQTLSQRLDAFERRWQPEIDAFDARWGSQTYSTEDERIRLERKRDEEAAELVARRDADIQALGALEHSGFSLDPSYDFDGLTRDVADALARLPMLPEVAGIIEISDAEGARAGLMKRDIVPLLILFDKLERSGVLSAMELGIAGQRLVRQKYQFQAARYDGELAGTEVGMSLFYTDLLAKLWAIDYMQSAPASQVEDFRPMTAVEVSPVFRQELLEFPSTRLWFGQYDRGFQIVGDGESLVLARNATRVYAASSNPLEPGKETEPAAQSEAFLGWWNDHYEEVARYEPEYERLNQIMKWSIVLGWLNAADRANSLGFLEEIRVDRSQWFPDWVKRHPKLRYHDWGRVGFHRRNHLGSRTETMPILFSKSYKMFGDEMALSGGVSLAPKQLFKERKALDTSINRQLRRSDLNYARSDASGRSFHTWGGAAYKLSAPRPSHAGLAVSAREGIRLRTRAGELGLGSFERTILQEKSGIAINTAVGGKPLGSLQITKNTNGFSIGWRGRDIDATQAVLKRASRGPDLVKALRADHEVEMVIQLPGEQQYAVKLRGGERWVKLSPEAHPTAKLEGGWDGRVADPAAKQNLRYVLTDDPHSLVAGVADDGYLVVDRGRKDGSPLLRFEDAPDAPHAAKDRITFWDNRISVIGYPTGDGTKIRVRWGDIRAQRGDDSLMLASRIARAPPPAPSSVTAGQLRIALPRGSSSSNSPLIRGLHADDPHAVAKAVSQDPVAAAKQLQENLRQGIDKAEMLMAEGRFLRAGDELDALIDVHGPIPDLKLRKAVALIERGKTARALEAVDQAKLRPLRDSKAFFDEINARLQNQGDGVERARLARFADYAHWSDNQVRTPKVGERMVAVTDGEQVELHFEASRSFKGETVSPTELADVHSRNALIYVQDSPGLNNRDWSVSVKKTLTELPSGNLPKVIRLKNEAISQYLPDKIYATDPTVHFTLADKSHSLHSVHGNYGRSEQRCDDSRDTDCRNGHVPKTILLVLDQ